jgi:hypothetical protein
MGFGPVYSGFRTLASPGVGVLTRHFTTGQLRTCGGPESVSGSHRSGHITRLGPISTWLHPLVFRQMYGGFSTDRRVAIASASKLVAGTLIFRLIDAGYLPLDSTTAEVLGWSGDKGAITLRHLLSFESGLPPEQLCAIQINIDLADCVDAIEQQSLIAPPGTLFEYGSTHLQVAARMADRRGAQSRTRSNVSERRLQLRNGRIDVSVRCKCNVMIGSFCWNKT